MMRDVAFPFEYRYLTVGGKRLLGISLPLGAKRLVVLTGSRGYVMCGYLNLSAANRFGDVAVKVSGVATIADCLKARVHAVSRAAQRCGIRPGVSIKQILPLIA